MLRTLIGVAVIVALLGAILILWVLAGQRISLFLDRFGKNEIGSEPVESISYNGSGTGGAILINRTGLSLDSVEDTVSEVHIGTTKDEQLALSYGGKVFPFGPVRSSEKETLAAGIEPADAASLARGHSYLCWPTFNRGQWPVWNRYDYYQLTWKKQAGAKLEIVWRNGPNLYWNHAWLIQITTQGELTGLIRVDISAATR